MKRYHYLIASEHAEPLHHHWKTLISEEYRALGEALVHDFNLPAPIELIGVQTEQDFSEEGEVRPVILHVE